MTYKNKTYAADYNTDGTIHHEGETYLSPSAFSISLKRKDVPTKKGDNGWTSVKYGGVTLDALRGQLALLQAQAELLRKSPSKNGSCPSTTSSSSSSTTSSTTSSSSSSTSSSTSSISSTTPKAMSAREKNDLLLAAMKERGEASGQKVTLVMKPMTPEELAAKNLIAENLQKIENAKAEEKKKITIEKNCDQKYQIKRNGNKEKSKRSCTNEKTKAKANGN